MPIEALDNDRWGFETNCFVCERRNERGLRIPFHHDTDRGLVLAEVTLGNEFSGAPTWVHGGVTLAILDEAMAWATIAVRHRWAVTKESQAWFDRPVLVGRPYRVEARITDDGDGNDEVIHAEAELVSADKGKVCVRARAVLSVVTAVQAPRLGANLEGEGAGYVGGAGADETG